MMMNLRRILAVLLTLSLFSIALTGCPTSREDLEKAEAEEAEKDDDDYASEKGSSKKSDDDDDSDDDEGSDEDSDAKEDSEDDDSAAGLPDADGDAIPSDDASKAAHKAEVYSAVSNMLAAWKQRDLDKVMTHFDKNVISIYKGQDDIGYAGMHTAFADFFKNNVRFDVAYNTDHIWTSPNLAVVQFTQTTTFFNKGKPSASRDRGIDVWRKDGGQWKIYWTVQYGDKEDKRPGRMTRKALPNFDINTIENEGTRAKAKEVRKASNQLYGSFTSLDYDSLMEMIGDDAVFMTPGSKDSDKSATGKDMRELFAMNPTITAKVGIEEIVVSGDLAVVRFVMAGNTVVPKRGKFSSTDRGFDVWRQEKGGDWKIVSSAQYSLRKY